VTWGASIEPTAIMAMGQFFTLVEPMQLKQGYGGVEVFHNPEGYHDRLIVKEIGIILTILGFCVQAWGILLQLWART
jgi:hypothetical protein